MTTSDSTNDELIRLLLLLSQQLIYSAVVFALVVGAVVSFGFRLKSLLSTTMSTRVYFDVDADEC